MPDALNGVSTAVTVSNIVCNPGVSEQIATVDGAYYAMRFNFRINSVGSTLIGDDITQLSLNSKSYYDYPSTGSINYYLWNYDSSPAQFDLIGTATNRTVAPFVLDTINASFNGTYDSVGKYVDNSGNFVWLIESIDTGNSKFSCPLAFAFDGNEFQLVADVFPMASLGHPYVPFMEKLGIDPDEYVKINKILPNKEGLLELRFVEALDEVSFFDQVKLLAVDHPLDIQILPNEYPTRSKPFPEFKIFQYQKLLPVKKAYDKNGADLTEVVRDIDGLYVPTKKTDIAGIVEPYSFILELGDLSDAKQIQLVVNSYTTFMTPMFFKNFFKGLFHFPDLPVIEVPDGRGSWREVKFKGSKNKMSLKGGDFANKDLIYDLTGEFVNNDFRVRIQGNLDVSFDCFKINTFNNYKPVNITELKPKSASLNAYGKLEKTYLKVKGEIPYFDYYKVSKSYQAHLPQGQYTRYGDITELVKEQDDKLVIMGTGDQISVKFDERELPKLPAGFKRTYLLYSFGYYKWVMDDRPLFKTVGQLPFKAMSGYPYSNNEHYPLDQEYKDYLEKYNTRSVPSTVNKNEGNGHHTMYVNDAYVTVSYNLVPTVSTPTEAASTLRMATNGTGFITVKTNMTDANSDTTQKMKLEYSVNGGTSWNKAYIDTTAGNLTADSGTPVLNNSSDYQISSINAPSGGNNITFNWDSKNASNGESTIRSSDLSTVKVRITPYNTPTSKDGALVATDNFTVDNKGPDAVESDSKYSYNTKLLSIRFNETIKTEDNPSDFDLTDINVTDGGVNSMELSSLDSFVVNDSATYNDDTLDITLSDSERDTIDSWNASDVYAQVEAGAVKDYYGNSNTNISNTDLVYTPSATNSFSVEPNSTSLRAGEDFTLTVTAKTGSGGGGSIDASYSGTVSLTINYISPTTPTTMTQTITTTPINLVAGVGTATLNYSDCGKITIKATDDNLSTRTGTSNEITFSPYSFTVVVSEAIQTVAKPFNLTVTAKNSAGSTTPNYAGIANLTENGDSGVLSDTQIVATDFSNGADTISESYDKYGTIKITAVDSNNTNSTGTSLDIKFIPNSFRLAFETPPKDRTKFYINEPFKLEISALDYTNAVITNYTGEVAVSSTNDRFVSGLDPVYSFVSADNGKHTISNIKGTAEKDFTISLKDSENNSVTGTSDVDVMYGKIVVVSKSGTVGKIKTLVKIVDKNGKIITKDNSTKFKVCIQEEVKDSSITCQATAKPITVSSGIATIEIDNRLAEKIIVTPMPEPDSLATESGTIIFGAIQPGASNTFQWREVR